MNFILILLIIHCIGSMLFQTPNSLYCGIFGWAGKTPKKFNDSKFNVLGIMNETRGEHSCGISIDGQINIGIEGEKLYRDFILLQDKRTPTLIPTVLGHTRQASIGMPRTPENAHPFGFGNNKGKYKFVGVHNGTIHNYLDLAEKYKIDVTAKIVKNNITSYRQKIDSEVLLEAIYSKRNYNVLKDYAGAAALIFYDTRHPNVMYVFRGASRKAPNTPDAKELYERPLYYYQETRNSLYVSSIEESLVVIGGIKEKNLFPFLDNTIYKITDGNMATVETFKVDRSKMFHEKQLPAYGRHNDAYAYGGMYGHGGRFNDDDVYDSCGTSVHGAHTDQLMLPINRKGLSRKQIKREAKRIRKESKTTNATIKKGFNSRVVDKLQINIHNETTIKPQKEYKAFPYFNKLRFYRNGHLITGIFTYVTGYGYHFLGTEEKEAISTFNFLLGKGYDGSSFSSNLNNSYIPFKLGEAEKLNANLPFAFFYNGIQMKDFADYTLAKQRAAMGTPLSLSQLSLGAKHPIITLNIASAASFDSFQGIILDGKQFNGKFAILGGDRIYDIQHGNLKAITNLYNMSSKEQAAAKFQILDLSSLKIDQKKESDKVLLTALLDEIFLKTYENLPKWKKDLEKFKDQKDAVKAITLLTSLECSISDVII